VKHPEGLNKDLVIKLGPLSDIADLVKINKSLDTVQF